MSKLGWTARATRDLLAIERFIAKDDPTAAARLRGILRTRAQAAARMPRMGRRVPEQDRDDIREVVVRNYRLIYQVAEKGINVLAIFETHRSFPAL
jgi:plasmid stabilization system protein ParE